jgi:hypothetical protein
MIGADLLRLRFSLWRTAMRATDLPADLLRGRCRFEAWRRQRQAGRRIPQTLWALAVRLVQSHGVSRTSAALGLDYYSLKKQAEAAAESSPSTNPPFVELETPMVVGKRCLVELDDGSGATMRMQLLGYDAADIEALTRSWWSGK